MNSESEFDLSFNAIYETLKELEIETANEVGTSESAANLKEENVKLKETNICLEKKVSELQSRLERLSTHYQSIVSSQDLKSVQENLLKSAPKVLEEENAALCDAITKMEVQLFHAAEEKRQSKEKWKLHEQKMDRLVDLISHLMSRMNNLEKQMTVVSDTCKKIKPTARVLAECSADLKLSQSHSRCRLDQLAAELAEQRRMTAAAEAQLASARARLSAQESEAAEHQAAVQEQRDEALMYKKHATELRSRLQSLQAKLAEAHNTIRDQSEVLTRLYVD